MTARTDARLAVRIIAALAFALTVAVVARGGRAFAADGDAAGSEAAGSEATASDAAGSGAAARNASGNDAHGGDGAAGGTSGDARPARSSGNTVRGVIISTHIDGTDWGSDAMVSTMRDIRAVGANWVATHPYARIDADGSVRFRSFDPADPPDWIDRPIQEAHALGLHIMIKPHLAYWGSGFRWRGEIDFDDDAAWQRFWSGYERWIVGLARACRDADAFVVGTELRHTLDQEERWRRLIAAVREQTGAPLTYAANWDVYGSVGFWDALDAIGIQAYFPLTDTPDPDADTLVRAWEVVLGAIRQVADRHRLPVVFTELGYGRSLETAARPWTYADDGPVAADLQQRCMRAALEAVEREPRLVGAFLWKWFPNPHPVGRNFQLATPAMRRTIARVWLGTDTTGGAGSE
ncbi:MAG: hypothetical protein PVF43_10975 [Candidatus Eiseniibacteriota bacterium]